jgi:hypothetical protein
MRPLRGRGRSLALSGGVAPGYYLVPLQGTKKLSFGLTPRHTVSGITDRRIRLSMLRMTTSECFSTNCQRRRGLLRGKVVKEDELQNKVIARELIGEGREGDGGVNARDGGAVEGIGSRGSHQA